MEESQNPEVKSQVVKFSTADISSPQKAKKKTPIVVLIILAVVLFVPIAVISYLIATGKLDIFNKVVDDGKEDTQEEQTEEKEGETPLNTSDWETWTGEYLSAKLPEGWRIAERYNVQGTRGFDGFDIFNSESDKVFVVNSIPPMGWTGCDCTEYYLFEDSNLEGYNQMVANSQTTETKDLCGDSFSVERIDLKKYTEFNLLNNKIRRVGLNLFIDDIPEDSTFDVGCNFLTVVNLKDLSTGKTLNYIGLGGEEITEDYMISIGSFLSDNQAQYMSILEQILGTISIVSEYDWDSEETAQPDTKAYEQMDFTERQQFIVDMMTGVKTSIQDGLVFLQNPVTHVSYVSTESSSGMLTGYILMHNKGSAKESDFDQVVNTLSTKGYAVGGLSVDSPSLKYQTLTYFDSVCAVSRRWSDFPVSTKYGKVYDMYVFCGVGDIAAVDSAGTEKVLNIIDDVTMIDFNGITGPVTVATKTVNDLDVFLKGKSLVPRTSSTRTTEDDLFFIDEVLKKLGYWYNPSARNVGYFKQAPIGDQENRYYFDNKETYCKATWVDSSYRPLTIYCGTID